MPSEAESNPPGLVSRTWCPLLGFTHDGRVNIRCTQCKSMVSEWSHHVTGMWQVGRAQYTSTEQVYPSAAVFLY